MIGRDNIFPTEEVGSDEIDPGIPDIGGMLLTPEATLFTISAAKFEFDIVLLL